VGPDQVPRACPASCVGRSPSPASQTKSQTHPSPRTGRNPTHPASQHPSPTPRTGTTDPHPSSQTESQRRRPATPSPRTGRSPTHPASQHPKPAPQTENQTHRPATPHPMPQTGSGSRRPAALSPAPAPLAPGTGDPACGWDGGTGLPWAPRPGWRTRRPHRGPRTRTPPSWPGGSSASPGSGGEGPPGPAQAPQPPQAPEYVISTTFSGPPDASWSSTSSAPAPDPAGIPGRPGPRARRRWPARDDRRRQWAGSGAPSRRPAPGPGARPGRRHPGGRRPGSPGGPGRCSPRCGHAVTGGDGVGPRCPGEEAGAGRRNS